ncbi:MAG: PAS domain-containing protein [Sulfurimonas sp.]|nr:PAS domain-containing protein [Sulfurimonas sp.]
MTMINSHKFLKSVLDTVTQHIAVIDGDGQIVYVNKSWITFGQSNSCCIDIKWEMINYLNECDKAASNGDEFGTKAAEGIRDVINGTRDSFYFEYPCHSPYEKRWFMMRVKPFKLGETDFYVICT